MQRYDELFANAFKTDLLWDDTLQTLAGQWTKEATVWECLSGSMRSAMGSVTLKV